MIGLLVTGFYVMGIIMAMHAALTTRTSTGAVAWTVSLVTMPFIAVPAYAVFGRNQFGGMVEAYEERADEVDPIIDGYRELLTPWTTPRSEAPSWYNAVHKLAEFGLVRGNSVELLINGEATFDSILKGIAQAERYILFQFYMIHDDGLGTRVKDALTERARAGVKVLVLYDEVGSSGLPDSYVDDLRAAGIEVSSFKPNQGWRNRFQLNFRNHRKMVVVDGRVAWVGGHNVGDEYLGLDPDFSPWRDTHVKIEGPAAIQVQLTSLWDWYWATRELPELEWEATPATGADQQVMILPTAPIGHVEQASLFFVSALSAAQKRIWLSAPYFVPDEAVMKALQLAALRGVDVRIITTGTPDSLPVYLAAFHYIEELRGLGIRFYAYKPGFLHEKVMLIDDRVSSVGTHNFDNRSFRLNFEVAAVILDEGFAAQMEAMFEQDFAHAEPIDPDSLAHRPLWWRLGVKLSRLAAPVL
ncbi:cardiolipin synthase [Marinobacter salinisoli]|uniref:Cardiolipin synthase n=1 Tax=Marinobacter salinisoli TaxID=2769486 RepID=A0ABX7MR44_9GAMM|nr:cardiolipin synthase [Marinobacter salinisoli]QSP94812.1 cardiolipin synthase [Marinobacter salinisoli]